MHWTKQEHVIWEELNGSALLIDTKCGTRWTLSAAATAAWKLCDGKRTLTDMSRSLRQHRAAIIDFCQQFETLGLLQRQGTLNQALVAYQSTNPSPFCFQSASLGAGSRRRPSPRGNSSPG